MKDLYLIGLTGAAGAGKDSVAVRLHGRHGYLSIAFATALRSEIAYAWNVPVELLLERKTKEARMPSLALGMCRDMSFVAWAYARDMQLAEPRSPRYVMQLWGTEYRRAKDPDYWVRIVDEWIKRKHAAGYRHLVITDVRFPNEAALIRHYGGKLLRVVRPSLAGLADDTAQHASEQQAAALQVDGDILNDGTLHDLACETERVVAATLGPGSLSTLVTEA